MIVAKSDSDFTGIQTALDSITNASDTNRYLVRVAPGVYTERVTMKHYVDIEGSGELTTKITYGGSSLSTTGTVAGASDAELRFMTVENTGGTSYAGVSRILCKCLFVIVMPRAFFLQRVWQIDSVHPSSSLSASSISWHYSSGLL
ncbi:MAG: hypothetical protein IT388_09100 [Nitrospirales bacterium]|nr:hypothetical protein [Nitrospirales bacterium]